MANYVSKIIQRYKAISREEILDQVAVEFPLTVFINKIEVVTLVCSPDLIKELVVGFLFGEGLINTYEDILMFELQHHEGLVNVDLRQPPSNLHNFLKRNIASCCGKSRAGLYFINDARQVKEIPQLTYTFEAHHLRTRMQELESKSQGFHRTGGIHSCALGYENIICMAEDIGRHNTVDKVIGTLIMNNKKAHDQTLLLSGRISTEITIKAVRAQIPVVVSRSAPTDLALNLANDLNLTVIGFAREEGFNIYTHPERII